MGKKVLIVTTSADKLADGQATGSWAEEFMAPYLMFKKAGYEVKAVSIKGGKVPMDAASYSDDFVTDAVKEYQADSSLKDVLEKTDPLDKVSSAGEYDAIYVPGGHGTAMDLPENSHLQKLLAEAFEAGKIVSSVCHGPVAFSNVKLSNGKYMVDSRKVTGFSNTEEEAVGKTKAVPFLLEDKLKEIGGHYSKGSDWTPYAVADGNLITGQNPQSSEAVAKHVISALGS